MATNNTTLHGFPEQGPTQERPVNPPGGFRYFDTTIRTLMYWDTEGNGGSGEWRPLGVIAGTTAQRPNAQNMLEGTLYYDRTLATLFFTDGVVWSEITIADPQSSSSTSSSTSSASSNSSSSTSSSSTSTSSSTSSESSST